jgi:hypothetical protein
MEPQIVAGKSYRWTFFDGPMQGRSFEHVFRADGGLSFVRLDAAGFPEGLPTRVATYEAASLGRDVTVISYLSPSGTTLTTVLDHRSGLLVAVASNENDFWVQHGRFEEVRVQREESARPGERRV